jgi:hypothetical protein
MFGIYLKQNFFPIIPKGTSIFLKLSKSEKKINIFKRKWDPACCYGQSLRRSDGHAALSLPSARGGPPSQLLLLRASRDKLIATIAVVPGFYS